MGDQMKLKKAHIARLRELGYQYSPAALRAVGEKQINEAMIYEWQHRAAPQIKAFMPAFHGPHRALRVDGELGPATVASFGVVRCGCPDFRQPGTIQSQLSANAEARWPETCSSALTWALNKDINLKGLTFDQIMQAFRLAFDCWARNLKGVKFVENHDDYEGSHFRETMADLGAGGTLARHIVGTSNGCSDSIWGQVNSRLNWEQGYLTTVLAHEIGHGMDFDHVNDDTALMNPYITRPAIGRQWWDKPNSTDLAEARRRGYTLEKTPPGNDPDDPEPPTTPNKLTISIPAHVTVDGVVQGGSMRWVGDSDGTGNGWDVT